MPNSIQAFDFASKNVRVFTADPLNPLFVAFDVASALGYKKPRNAVSRHCKRQVTAPKQGGGNLILIPESDLYRLTFKSRLDSAERFTDWVVEEILPAIRKTGQYKAPTQPERITPEQKGHIYQSVLDICRSQNIHYAVLFGGLKRQFGLAKYDELPRGKYLEACQYLGIKPLEGEYLPKSEHPTDEQFKTDAFRLSQYALQMAHWFSDYYQPLRQLGVKRIDAMHESMDGIKIYSEKLIKGENKWGVLLTR